MNDLPEPESITRRSKLRMRGSGAPEAGAVTDLELPVFSSDGRSEAQRLIDEARDIALQMVEQTRAAREAELAAARTQGYEEGIAQADAEMAGLIATAEAIATNTALERDRLLTRAEEEIVTLAIAIASRIVDAAIEADPTLVLDVCRGAMRKAFQREHMTVLAHPDDLALLRRAGPSMAAELGGVERLEFVEERRISRGSVIVRTSTGEIDATIAGKSEMITRELLEVARVRRATIAN